MTRTPNREAWFISWKKEAEHLFQSYQCLADGDLYDRLDETIKATVGVIFDISIRMEAEGVWKKVHENDET